MSYEIFKDCMINDQREVKVAKAQHFSDLINRLIIQKFYLVQYTLY